MKRRFSNLLTILAMLLCAVTILLWVRSYFGSDYISRAYFIKASPDAVTTHIDSIMLTRGSVRFSSTHHTYYPNSASSIPPPRQEHWWGYGRLGSGHIGWDFLENDNTDWFNRLGFHFYETGHSASFYDAYEHIFAIPAWLPTAISALPALFWTIHLLKRRRRNRIGLCPTCGYDIRATPQRCPECGRVALANH